MSANALDLEFDKPYVVIADSSDYLPYGVTVYRRSDERDDRISVCFVLAKVHKLTALMTYEEFDDWCEENPEEWDFLSAEEVCA